MKSETTLCINSNRTNKIDIAPACIEFNLIADQTGMPIEVLNSFGEICR